jgi:hypothetical protein
MTKYIDREATPEETKALHKRLEDLMRGSDKDLLVLIPLDEPWDDEWLTHIKAKHGAARRAKWK